MANRVPVGACAIMGCAAPEPHKLSLWPAFRLTAPVLVAKAKATIGKANLSGKDRPELAPIGAWPNLGAPPFLARKMQPKTI